MSLKVDNQDVGKGHIPLWRIQVTIFFFAVHSFWSLHFLAETLLHFQSQQQWTESSSIFNFSSIFLHFSNQAEKDFSFLKTHVIRLGPFR